MSTQQHDHVQDRREIDDEPYDAVASIETGEHVGAANYPTYTANLYRLLLQQTSRGLHAPGDGPSSRPTSHPTWR